MPVRAVTLIDTDAALTGHLQRELTRFGLHVDVSPDPNEVMARKDGLPDLIVLCIDPKRTGWAICNRLRKSPTLKSVPLIITSAEATEKDFEDHKKLKTRAEEYLHKPFAFEALTQKIAGILGPLAPAAAPSDEMGNDLEIPLEPDEIAVEDASELVEEEGTTGVFTGPGADLGFDDLDESTRIGMNNVSVEMEAEADAAFDAVLAADPPSEPTGPGVPNLASVPQPEARAHAGGEALEDPFSSMPEAAEEMPTPFAAAPAATPARATADDLDLGLDDVARQVAAAPQRQRVPTPVGVAATPRQRETSFEATTAAHDAATVALAGMSRELERLQRELEAERNKSAAKGFDSVTATGFSREREFLNLREIINKKEKEILDLRDALDGKERQILDGKDKLREIERRTRDNDEKVLGGERELVAAREKIEALTVDKERVVERERQLKGRFDDAHKQLVRAEEEVEALKKKHAADLGALERRHVETASAHQAQLAALQTANAEALAVQADEHAGELRAVADQHVEERAAFAEESNAERGRLEAEHARQTAQLRESQAALLAEAQTRHAAELAARDRQHAETLKRELDAHVAEHTAELQQLMAEQMQEKERIEQAQEQAVNALDAQHQADLQKADEEHRGALARMGGELEQKATAMLAAAQTTLQQKLQSLEEAHADQKAGMQQRHGVQVAELEAAIQQRGALVEEAQERMAELDAALAQERAEVARLGSALEAADAKATAALAEVAERDLRLGEREQRIADLERESAGYQEQILKAYQRLKTDENTVARAKKALAIALTLLDESTPDGGEQPSS
jgi:CheY-like chemotaxis protein